MLAGAGTHSNLAGGRAGKCPASLSSVSSPLSGPFSTSQALQKPPGPWAEWSRVEKGSRVATEDAPLTLLTPVPSSVKPAINPRSFYIVMIKGGDAPEALADRPHCTPTDFSD